MMCGSVNTKILASLLTYLLFAQPVWATTYYIRTDGNNANAGTTDSAGGAWRTMGKCATTAAAGDTCIVKDGTYVEGEVQFNTNDGSSGNYITLKAENKHGAILSSTSGCNPNISIYKDYIHIDGIRTKVDSTNTPCSPVTSSSGTGVRCFEGSPLPSVATPTTANHHAWIENTTHDASSARGHSIKCGFDDSIIENNIAYNGLEASAGRNYIIRNNQVLGGDQWGSGLIGGKFGNRNAQVYKNFVRCTVNWANCFTLGGAASEGNHFDSSTDIECYNCVAYDNVVVGVGLVNPPIVGLRGCKDCLWAYNTHVGTLAPLTLGLGGGSSTASNADPTFKFNIVAHSGACTNNFSAYTGTRTVDYNLFYTCTSAPSQTNAITGNPLLGGDYTLGTGSPAIDAIPAASALTTWPAYGGGTITLDLTNAPTWQSATYSPRPDNTDYDVGAYEFYTPDGQGGEGGQSQEPTATSPRRHPLGWWR